MLSKYQIKWQILEPQKGKATQKDLTLLNKQYKKIANIDYSKFSILGNKNFLAAWHGKTKILSLKKIKLSKKYKVYTILDVQLEKAKFIKGNLKIDFTKKQKELSYSI